MHWKTNVILETLDIKIPKQNEIDFIDIIINSGKTDNMQRSIDICSYLNKEGVEKIIYDKLCVLNQV